MVFQTKLSPSNEDAAIKRVLQDKRFKVCTPLARPIFDVNAHRMAEPRASDHANRAPPQHCAAQGLLLL